MFKFLTVLILTASCGTQEGDKGSSSYPIISYDESPCVSCSNRADGEKNETKTSAPAEDKRVSKVLTEPEEILTPTPTSTPTPTPTPDVEPVEVNLPPSEFQSLTVSVVGTGKVNDTTLTCEGTVTDPEGDRIFYETAWEKSYDGVAWEALPFDNQSHSIEVTYASGLFLQRPMIRCKKTAWDAMEQNRDETRSATSDVFTVVNSAPTFAFNAFSGFLGLNNLNDLVKISQRQSIVLNSFLDLDGDYAEFESTIGGGCEDIVTSTFGWFTDNQNRTYPRIVATYTGPLAGETPPFDQNCHANLFVSDGLQSVYAGQYPIQVEGI